MHQSPHYLWSQQWNAYAYANNNPTTLADPSGLMPPLSDRGEVPRTSCYDACQRAAIASNRGQIPIGTAEIDYIEGHPFVCVHGYACMDERHVKIHEYINAYNVEIDRRRARWGELTDTQVADAMWQACFTNTGKSAAGNFCDSIIIHDLDLISSSKSVAAYESAHGASRSNAALSAGLDLLTYVAGLPSCVLRVSFPVGKKSFSGDTPVLVDQHGHTKKLKDVRVGDSVMATDPGTGDQGLRAVTKVWVHKDDLYTLVINGEKLATTEDHPFWNTTDRRWERADQLDPGDRLRTYDGTTARVDDFVTGTRHVDDAYNLSVAGIHTYYVLAGDTPILVHNCGGSTYEAGGKHGPTARNSIRGTNSAEPTNGQGALENSIEWTPEGPGQAPRRIGVSDGEIVVLDRTRQAPCGCSVDGGVNDIWHGHVRSWDELSPGMQSAVRKAGLVDRKGRPLA
ncbi:polymorphic toxin-type HINT domain-containing protein [Staphylococcus capitis]|uniref:polymorphic toxin-type HINT domain-containing protein n=1 Tax=Staphylococcus capitis TaxID=29388 RepID=UPI003D000564